MPLTMLRPNSPPATPAHAHRLRLAVTLAAIGLLCALAIPSFAHAFNGSVKTQPSTGGTAIAPTTTYAPTTTTTTQPGLATQTSTGSPTTTGVTHSTPARKS